MNYIAQLQDRKRVLLISARNSLENHPGKHWTAAHQREYDATIAEVERIESKLRTAENDEFTAEQLIQFEETRVRDETLAPLFRKYLRQGFEQFTDDQRRTYRNTMSTTTGSQGGFTVPSQTAKVFADVLKDFSSMRRNAEVFQTDTGDATWGYPTSDGTSEVGEFLAENAAASSQDPSFASASLQTFKVSSKIITAPIELVMDSNLDFENYIMTRVAARIGRISNTKFTVGSGTNEPTGFTTVASVGKVGTTGETTTIIHDDVIDLIHSVDPGYRQYKTGAVFMGSDAIFKVLRKLKDTTNQRPIYLPAGGDTPESVMGYSFQVNNDVAVPAANAKSLFFGNFFLGYKIRDSLEVTLFRMEDSAYAKLGQVAYLAFARTGGNCVDGASIKYFQQSAT
jgi:HK97 family phage major capsid protein